MYHELVLAAVAAWAGLLRTIGRHYGGEPLKLKKTGLQEVRQDRPQRIQIRRRAFRREALDRHAHRRAGTRFLGSQREQNHGYRQQKG